MFIYNITTQVSWGIHEEWLKWQLSEHIPQIMGKGCFTKYQMQKLLEIDDTEGPTYAIQYYAESKADYNRYIELYAPELRKTASARWGEQFVSFRTLMQVVH